MCDVCTCALSKECCSGGRAPSHLTRGEHSESSASIACMCTVLRTLLRRDGHVPLLPEVHVLSSDSGRVCREPLNSARMGYGHQRRFQTPLACHPLRLITWCGPHQPNPPPSTLLQPLPHLQMVFRVIDIHVWPQLDSDWALELKKTQLPISLWNRWHFLVPYKALGDLRMPGDMGSEDCGEWNREWIRASLNYGGGTWGWCVQGRPTGQISESLNLQIWDLQIFPFPFTSIITWQWLQNKHIFKKIQNEQNRFQKSIECWSSDTFQRP